MNKFLKNVKTSIYSKENSVKNSIISQLSVSVKEVQLCGMSENISEDSLEIVEAGNTLCSTIEAMFLHGLKDSLAHRVRRAITDLDEKPEHNFWAPLLIISHRQIIDQIMKLSQITTEIGQCRAWIRLALNDCLLSSYLISLRHDSQTLKPYYNGHAFLRDGDVLDVAQRLIEGMESTKMVTVPCNSSLLNTWPNQSLLLAGIWAPPLRLTVVSGVDVAESLDTNKSVNSETCSLNSMMSLQSHSSGIGQMVNEDEALKIILAKHSLDQNNSSLGQGSDFSDNENKSYNGDNVKESISGNSLNLKSGWSFDETQEVDQKNYRSTPSRNVDIQNAGSQSFNSPNLKSQNFISDSPNFNSQNLNSQNFQNVNSENGDSGLPEGSKSMEHSYNALIDSYNMIGANYIKTPDLREIWQKFENIDHDSGREDDEVNKAVLSPEESFISNSTPQKSEAPVSLAVQIGQIAKEKGLDIQEYECLGCKQYLGVSSKSRVCFFTGSYFCENCMAKDPILIPARVIHNWDFKNYPVSQKAFNYIEEIKDHPTIDLKILNPFIYVAVEEMGKLQILRNQLNFLRAYLYTCREPIIEQLQKQMWPREYMYEHIHQYSISDLYQISDGVLAQHMQKVISFGKEHVMGCWLCSQKGFLCEVCNKSKPLFPFDTDNVFRCDMCSAVYHNNCLNPSKPCPKCERRKKRDDFIPDVINA